jgi:hypothetical protein
MLSLDLAIDEGGPLKSSQLDPVCKLSQSSDHSLDLPIVLDSSFFILPDSSESDLRPEQVSEPSLRIDPADRPSRT